MKQTLVNGKLVTAAPDAPATAACPHCDGAVKLRVANMPILTPETPDGFTV